MTNRRMNGNGTAFARNFDLSSKKSLKEKLIVLSLPLTFLAILTVLICVVVLSLNVEQEINTPVEPITSVTNDKQPGLDQLFNKKLSEYNIGIEQAHSVLHWSPNDNYIIFEGLKSTESYDLIPTVVVIADLINNEIVKIRDGQMLSEPTWSPDGKTVAISFQDGLFIYDVISATVKKIDGISYMPRFSPDGSRISYYNDGICLYDVSQFKSTRITDKRYYAAPQWFADGKSILAFREEEVNKNGRVQKQQMLSVIETDNTYNSVDIVELKKNKISDALWLKVDEILYITATEGNTKTHYIADIKDKTVLSIGELNSGVVGSEIYLDKSSGKIMKVHNGTVEVFDYRMNMINSFNIDLGSGALSYKDNQHYGLLTNGRVVFQNIDAYYTRSAILVADPLLDLVFRIIGYGEISEPRVSSKGDKIAVIIEAGKKLKIISAVEATGEVIPSVIVTIGQRQDSTLSRMLPGKVGTELVFEGSGGYVHTIKVDKISKDENNENIEYLLSGEVHGISNNDNEDSNKINIKYIVTQNTIRENFEAGSRFPHKIKEFDILRGPVEEGNEWTEVVMFEGERVPLKAEITKVIENNITGEKEISVSYIVARNNMQDGPYTETRVIRQGVGIESFSSIYDRYTKLNYQLKDISVLSSENNIQ